MKKLNLALISVLYILLASCSDNHKSESKYSKLDSTIARVLPNKDLKNDKYCIIIPKSGCSGCIEGATQYVKGHVDQMKGAQIIFTGVNDMKLLNLQMGSEFLSRSQVHIDKENLFTDIKMLSDYPQVLFLESGLVTKIEELDTSNPETLKKMN
jgi:hypothetical protein